MHDLLLADPFEWLPLELACHVLLFLEVYDDPRPIVFASMVCRRWHDQLWRPLYLYAQPICFLIHCDYVLQESSNISWKQRFFKARMIRNSSKPKFYHYLQTLLLHAIEFDSRSAQFLRVRVHSEKQHICPHRRNELLRNTNRLLEDMFGYVLCCGLTILRVLLVLVYDFDPTLIAGQ